MPELLLEILSEEIPARMQTTAARELERQINQRLLDAGFMPEGVKGLGGPRRLTFVATGLPAQQPDRREEKKGPRVGAPEKAVAGFLKSAGLSSVDDCEQREDKKGAYYVAVLEQRGKPTADIIADIVPDVMRGFSWAKSMRAGDQDLRWVRPIHSILCAFDNEVVDFSIEDIQSGDSTRGHRFLAQAEIRARNFEDYATQLAQSKVVLDFEERKEIIARDAATLCKAQGLELVEDAGLLNEVAGLAEWPVPMIGKFDEKFLTLPDEVLTASMRGHQKYFSVKNPKTDALANCFVTVANIESPDGGVAMRQGYERVLEARLSDAWYLYHQDLKMPLTERISDLDKVAFFEGLGSVGDKVRRIADLAEAIATKVGADPASARRAATLAKADLVTGMVYEFPELQGLMGRYYALEQGENVEIANAVRDHYRPVGQDDEAPTASVSIAVALAEKFDALFGFFAIEELPTGSKDPFALRRAALGAIRIILENELRVGIASLGDECLKLLRGQHGDSFGPGKTDSVLPFFHDRLKVYLREKDHRYDHIDALLVDAGNALQDDLFLITSKLSALETFLATDDGENLVSAFKRAANILKAEEKKDKKAADPVAVDKKVLVDREEKVLFDTLIVAEEKAAKSVTDENFQAAMAALATIRAPLDAFFDNVTVNADDQALRANRLSLLARFRAATATVADFSKLEG